jgi:hypothetical protein
MIKAGIISCVIERIESGDERICSLISVTEISFVMTNRA